MQPARERWSELAPLLLLVLAVALAWLAPAAVGAQLEARARADAALYRSGSSPFLWQFADPRARVGPLQGLRTVSTAQDALALELNEGRGDFGLRLSGKRIDPAALPTLQLDYASEAPLRLRLRAANDLGPRTLPGAWIDLPARPLAPTGGASAVADVRIALGATLPLLDGPIEQLRFEFEGRPDQHFVLRSARLLPARCGDAPCLPPRIELSEDHSTRWLLAVRDEHLAARPQVRVGADAPETLTRASTAVTGLDLPVAAVTGLLLALLAWSATQLRDGVSRSACALALGAIVPALLLSLGLPRFPPQVSDAPLLAAWAAALWLLWPRPAQGRLPWTSHADPANSDETEAHTGTATGTDEPSNRVRHSEPALRRRSNPATRAWILATGFCVLGSVALAAWVWWATSQLDLNPRAADSERLLRYVAWAAAQQFWLARFALPHLRALGLGDWTLPLAGLLFAGLHLPNLELMGLSFVGGCVWAWIADRHGRLLPQIASHAVLGLTTAALLPPTLLRSLEVGGRYVFAPL